MMDDKMIALQGKRLIKRLRKYGLKEEGMREGLVRIMREGIYKAESVTAYSNGASAEDAHARGAAAMAAIKTVEPSVSLGGDLFGILVVNGAAPGRCKSDLDNILFAHAAPFPSAIKKALDSAQYKFASGLMDKLTNPAAEIDSSVDDRFPTARRENY